MKRNHILAFGLFLSIFLMSCHSIKTTVELQPLAEPDSWFQGQGYVTDSLYGVSYEVAFDRVVGDYYVFDFYVSNRSNMGMLIDPQLFYYIPCRGIEVIDEKIAAVNPDEGLAFIDNQIKNKEKQRKKLSIFGVVYTIFDFITSAIFGSNDKIEDDLIRDVVAIGGYVGLAVADNKNAEALVMLHQQRQAWQSVAIRKIALKTNENIGGKVFFPIYPEATGIQLFLPVDDEYCIVDFNQVLTASK